MAAKKPLVIDFTTGIWAQLQPGDFIDISSGGTGATTAAGARTALGLAIGSAVQAWNANLDALAALNANGSIYRIGNGAYASRTLVAPASGMTIANPDGVAGNPTFAFANDLAALENLASTGFAVRTAADTWAQRSMATASNARLTVTNADGSSGNPTFDLATVTNAGGGTLQKFTQDSYGRVSGSSAVTTGDLTSLLNGSYLGLGGGTLTGYVTLHADPTQPMHPATMRYVDAAGQNRRDKLPVRLGFTVNINTANPGAIADGAIAAIAGDRVLLMGQTSQAQNGPWIFNGAGVAMTRPTDFDTDAKVSVGSTFFVSEGDNNKDQSFTLLSDGPFTLGTTALVFGQTSSTGQITPDVGLKKNGTTISLDLAARLSTASGKLDLASGVVSATTGTKVTTDTYGRVIGITNAIPADVGAQPASNELSGMAALTVNGLVARTASGAYSSRSLIAPAAGITVANADGVAGNPTLSLSNDLAGIEGLATFGFAVRTAADTWATRSMTYSSRFAVTNADGVAGNTTIDLAPTGVTAGQYTSVTVNQYGQVTDGVLIANMNTPGTTLLNDEVSAVVICTPVYIDSANGFKKANANALATSDVYGIAFATINSGVAGIIATSGDVPATTAQWDAVTGQTGGLTFGATYFLDTSAAGKLTSTPPSSGFLVPVGKAVGPTKLNVRIGQRIQL